MNKSLKIAIIGLGYVGLPIAYAFARKGLDVIGFDINQSKINQYKAGIDSTNEVGSDKLKMVKTLTYTHDEKDLDEANFFIIAVPTPINTDTTPNLTPVIKATETVSRHLKKGDTVVFESTVYPGVTEEVCLPILEYSGLKGSLDFKYGYSPERINPGDKVHRLESIIKVVSGCDLEALEHIASVYSIVVEVGVFKAKSIKVAEAAKVIENTQRDINIAFMNELAMIFNLMDISTSDVLEAASTKWNFLRFTPGLVGGHCIGVDPYYLTHKAQALGYHPQVILSGRRINDGMGKWIAENTVKKMIQNDIAVKGAKVLILGLTFKEDCPDLRNSKVVDIINELKSYGINPVVTDPLASIEEAKHEYGIDLQSLADVKDVDAVVFAVAHQIYRDLTSEYLLSLYNEKHQKAVMVDVKSVTSLQNDKFDCWRV